MSFCTPQGGSHCAADHRDRQRWLHGYARGLGLGPAAPAVFRALGGGLPESAVRSTDQRDPRLGCPRPSDAFVAFLSFPSGAQLGDHQALYATEIHLHVLWAWPSGRAVVSFCIPGGQRFAGQHGLHTALQKALGITERDAARRPGLKQCIAGGC